MIAISKPSKIVPALVLMMWPTLYGCTMTPSPSTTMNDKKQYQGGDQTNVRIDVYVVEPPPDRFALLNAESLEAAAESDKGLVKKLQEIGPTQQLFHLAQPVELQNKFSILVGTRLPIPMQSGKTKGGTTQTSVQYEEVGCKIEMNGSWGVKASWGTKDPQQGRIQMKLELSSVGKSSVKIGPNMQAPIFRTYKHEFGSRFTPGKPIVLISMNSNVREEEPIAYVIGIVFERTGL